MSIQKIIDFEKELNPQQLQVVTSRGGPALVIAGAGSGKTRTLTYRVAYLTASRIDPHRVILLTFTNKAAREMVGRVEAVVPCDVRKIWGGTFHHIANRILRVHGQRCGIAPNYTILDQSDAHSLLNTCLQDLGHAKKGGLLPQGSVLLNMTSLARNTRTGLDDIIQQRYPFFMDCAEDIGAVLQHYEGKKRTQNLLDFDDLLCKWLELMEEHADLREFYAERFQHILVDEYQDTNRLQADIIDVLGSCHRNIMVVGDDSQSIYAFRGAHFANIMGFPERYPDARVFKLECNYRSAPAILDLANASIVCNQKQFLKELQPVKQGGGRPVLFTPPDVYAQARVVADTIGACIDSGFPPGEIAVLYRAHFHSMELQVELSRRAIPFEVRSGVRFFEQAHMKDVMAYLKVMINPQDQMAWSRVLQLLPGIGTKTARKIFDCLSAAPDPLNECLGERVASMVPKKARPHWENLQTIISGLARAGADSSPAELVRACLDNGYREHMRTTYTDSAGRQDDLEQFVEFAWRYDSLQDFLSDVALLTGNPTDAAGENAFTESVKLSTIHQAKGLEWSVVFILWLAEGRFPNPNNFDSLDDEEEERRLFYVAVTRAKEQLYLCAPQWTKDSSGYVTALKPSRFLREIPPECYETPDRSDDYLR